MRRSRCVKVLISACFGLFLFVQPARAVWPSFDISAIFATIMNFITKVQNYVSTGQQTISTINTQASIGDNIGFFSKIFSDIEKQRKDVEKELNIKKRLEKIKELKEKYEETKQTIKDKKKEAEDMFESAKQKVEDAKQQAEDTVEAAKQKVKDAKQQAEDTVEAAKEKVKNVKQQAEDTVEVARQKVEDAKQQVEDTVKTTKEKVKDTKQKVEEKFAGAEEESDGAGRYAEDEIDLWDEDEAPADDGVREPSESTRQRPQSVVSGVGRTNGGTGQGVSDKSSVTKGSNGSTGQGGLSAVSGTGNTGQGAQEDSLKSTKPQAFKRVSYSFYTPISAAKSSFKVGSNKTGGQVLPDTLAGWCGIGYDGITDAEFDIDGDEMSECIDKICDALNAPEGEEQMKNVEKYQEVRDEAYFSALKAATEMKEKFATSKFEDEVSDTLKKGSGTEMSQLSGNMELSNAEMEIGQSRLIVKANKVEVLTLDAINNYCKEFGREGQFKEGEDKSNDVTTTLSSKIGTDEDGTRILPDTLAGWCNMGFDFSGGDFEPKDEEMLDCIDKICDALNEPRAEEQSKNIQVFQKIRKEAFFNALALTTSLKQKYASTDTQDTADQILSLGAGIKTQLAGDADIKQSYLEMQQNTLLLQASEMEIDSLNAMNKYCREYRRKANEV